MKSLSAELTASVKGKGQADENEWEAANPPACSRCMYSIQSSVSKQEAK